MDITKEILNYIPKRNQSPNGWHSFNCPSCHHRGHPRPDSKKRGGLYETSSGGFKYNCFNCKLKTGWEPGENFSNNCIMWFNHLGIPSEKVQEFRIAALRLSESSSKDNEQANIIIPVNSSLPEKSVKIIDEIDNGINDKRMLSVIEYLYNRNENIFNWFEDIYWTPKYPKRALFAFTNNKKTIGWIGRNCVGESSSTKYMKSKNNQHLFNMDSLFYKNRDYVILVEGIMDAIAGDCVGICGTEINDYQANLINSVKQNKEIVILPDRDKAGKALIKFAKENGWSVSMPPWEDGIKDLDEAVKMYGRFFAMKLVLENIYSNNLAISVKSKEWFQ